MPPQLLPKIEQKALELFDTTELVRETTDEAPKHHYVWYNLFLAVDDAFSEVLDSKEKVIAFTHEWGEYFYDVVIDDSNSLEDAARNACWRILEPELRKQRRDRP